MRSFTETFFLVVLGAVFFVLAAGAFLAFGRALALGLALAFGAALALAAGFFFAGDFFLVLEVDLSKLFFPIKKPL
jgi:hypothetical protein